MLILGLKGLKNLGNRKSCLFGCLLVYFLLDKVESMVFEPTCRMLVEFPHLPSSLIFDCVLFLPFQEFALSHCDVTCLEHMSPLLFAGTTSGSVIIWNLETEKIALRYSNYVYSIYELQRGVYRHYRSCYFL